MKKIFKYLANDPRQDMTIKSLAMKPDVHAITQPSFARLNRAGRTTERLLTLGGIFMAVSTGGVGLVTLGLAAGAKAAGLAAGVAVSKIVNTTNKKLNPYG